MSDQPTYEELEKRVQELEQAHSDLKRAKNALRESEERYRLHIQNITDVVYAIDHKFTLIDISPSVERVLGYKPEELIGRPFQDTDFLAPEHMEKAFQDAIRVLEGERIDSTEYLFIHQNGEKRWGEVSGAPIIVKDQIIGLIFVARDVTERKNVEDSLKFERDFSSRIMETSPAGITHVDPDGHVIYANKKAQEILGFRLATDGKRTYNDTAWKITGLDGEPFPNENLPFAVVKKTLKPVSDVQHAIEWPDGKTVFLSINAAPLLSASGEFEGMVATFDDITDRFRAKEDLQRSEERFSSMFEHMGTGVAVYEAIDGGSDFIFRAFNPAAEKITRISASQALGKRLLELFPQMDESGLLGSLQRVWRTGRSEHIPPFYYKDKVREGWRENRIYKLPSGEIVALFDDVTERIKAENNLKNQTKTLNDILEKAADGICLCHNIPEEPFVRFTHWNPRMTEITGYSMDEINQLGWYQSVYPDPEIRQKAIKRMANMRQGHDIQSEEWIVTTKDNRQKAVSISTSVVKKENDRIHVMAIMQDIDERKHYQDQLITSRKEWEDIFQAIGQPTIILDPKHGIVKANNATLMLTGLSENQLIGKKCFEIFHKSNSHPKPCPMEALLKKGSIDTIEMEMEALSGTFLVSCTPITDRDGNIEKIIHIATDISKTKKLEAELRHIQKMEAIGTLAGGIAHEFNNMLGIIIGNTELAIDDVPDWNPAKDCLKEIKTASLRAKDVVRKLLSVARKTPESRKPIQIGSIIKESLDLMRRTIPTTIDIQRNIVCSTEMILGDPTEISQVLINLCTNSVHAITEESGVLEVCLDTKQLNRESVLFYKDLEPGDYVRLTVNDTGKGIEPAFMHRLFDPYFTTKDVDQGLGMGLAVVHGIVKKHDGAIKIESEVGKGTTVEVLFPLIEGQTETSTVEIETLRMGTERVLLVDDEPSIVKMITQMLKRSGYMVIGKTSSASALKIFKETPEQFDLVISDMAMPEMSGDRLARAIKQIRSEIPVILCTGHSERMDESKAKERGIEAFIMKPFQKEHIANTVRKVLDEAKS